MSTINLYHLYKNKQLGAGGKEHLDLIKISATHVEF